MFLKVRFNLSRGLKTVLFCFGFQHQNSLCISLLHRTRHMRRRLIVLSWSHSPLNTFSKCKVDPRTGHKCPEGEHMYISTLPSTSALDGGGWSTPRPALFTPEKETRYPFYRRLGGPQGRSGRVRKISPPTGIRSQDRPFRSESLYRLSYRGP